MIEIIKRLLIDAITKCYETDYDLIVDGYERVIVAHIFSNMKNLIETNPYYNDFISYNLDNEYERHHGNQKYIDENKRVRPDIILHKRGIDDDNLLVVEFKTEKHASDENIIEDKKKLIKFTDPAADSAHYYHYQLGVFVLLDFDKIKCSYFENGRETKKNITIPMNCGISNA